ncbi:hypothetical protein Leryth_010673 [Lithospermum erythrorhizon]|nr:hypothetical protein Leryth_010673 [Lithospermum erythrorhizon]
MAATFFPISSLIHTPKSLHLHLPPHTSLSNISRIHGLSSALSLKETFQHHKVERRWRLFATPENFMLSDANAAVQDTQQIVSSPDNGVNTIVSSLLIVAFIGLSILTIGVIYIAVTDFLQKRESEKFEKQEAAKKKSGKKGKVRVRRDGPRGFGQKVELDDFDD